MSKILKIFSISFLSIVLGVMTLVPASAEESNKTLEDGYYPKSSEVYQSASPAMQSMYDLQNEITDNLSKENGRYVYEYQAIENIIKNYDFSEINKELDQKFSSETFLNLTIEGIDSTTFPTRTKRSFVTTKRSFVTGKLCGVNKTDSIWNAKREYRDKNNTASHIRNLNVDANSLNFAWSVSKANNAALLTGLYVLYPPLKWAVVAGGVAKAIPVNWMKGVARSLESSNYNGCGTVLDVNMVGWFSSWNQQEN